MGIALRLRFLFFDRQGRGAIAYAPQDVPGKGTNVGIRLCRRVICWGCPGPAVPDSGAYAIRPYPAGRLFSSKWVGAYCIHPIRRPRQGDECKTCIRHRRWRLKGVFDTPTHSDDKKEPSGRSTSKSEAKKEPRWGRGSLDGVVCGTVGRGALTFSSRRADHYCAREKRRLMP